MDGCVKMEWMQLLDEEMMLYFACGQGMARPRAYSALAVCRGALELGSAG